ncbi:MAG: transketolase [Nitrospirae bacterium]|nr:transketolase [Nitrospirota bacterium]
MNLRAPQPVDTAPSRAADALSAEDIRELRRGAYELRKDVVTMVYKAKSGHPGGALGHLDVLWTLFARVLRHDPKNPKWPDRDRFVLSNGHTCPGLYSVLARCGYFPREDLWTFRKLGSHLQGHTSSKHTPGVETDGGSLGLGLSQGKGMALAARLDGRPTRVYVLMSDGEQQEGQPWEAAMGAAHFKLDNLCGIIDYNRIQIDGPLPKIKEIEPLADKYRAFGWEVFEVDGHDIARIHDAFVRCRKVRGRPQIVIARVIPGRGVSFMENDYKWHHGSPTPDQYSKAMEELDAAIRSF